MEQAAGSPGILASILPLVVLFAIFYFLVIFPQQKQAKKHKEMVNELKKGDKVITSGGIYGEVTKAEEDSLQIKISSETTIKLSKEFIAKRLDETQN